MFYRNLTLAVALIALSSCGKNPDYGKEYHPNKKASSSQTAASTLPGNEELENGISYGPCKTMAVYGGSNPAYAQMFSGAQACADGANKIRLKVGASVPTTTSFCLVPVVSFATAATCFKINGQADLTLATSQYRSVVLVAESHLSSYIAYAQNKTNTYPPMATATLR